MAEVIEAAMELTPEERARVAHALIEADEGKQGEVDTAWENEVTGRLEEIRSGQVRGQTNAERRAFRRA